MTSPAASQPVRLGRRALLALSLLSPFARGLSRTPVGGVLRLALPLPLGRLDPHSGSDPASALFSSAVADPLYAITGDRVHPALAALLPEPHPEGFTIKLREGLVTARGRPLSAKDVVWSLERAKKDAARSLLSEWGKPRVIGPLAVLVPKPVSRHAARDAAPRILAEALSSPATAILSRRSSSGAPDGTGAFGATIAPERLRLDRNPHAARGPSYLDRIEITEASDLATSLRAFETGDTEIGFLGAGLHGKRPGAESIALPPVGYIVLRTGSEAGSWGAPGVARGLVENVDPTPFFRLGLRIRAVNGESRGWGGPPAEILVDESSAYFVEIAKALATALTREHHEITVRPMAESMLRSTIRAGRFSLALDFVRETAPTASGRRSRVLLQAVDPRLVRQGTATVESDVTVALPLGVLSELALVGARAADVRGLEGAAGEPPDLGSVFLNRA